MQPALNTDIVACPHCDTIHKRISLKRKERMVCCQCGSTIISYTVNFNYALIFAITALILFVIANCFPFITLAMLGEKTTISVYSGIISLFNNRLNLLALVVMLFIIIIPLWYLLSIIWVIISFRFKLLHQFSRRFLHWMHIMSPWDMLEVYLVGVIVTLVKIMQMATVHYNAGFWAFCTLIVNTIFIQLYFNLSDVISRDSDHAR